MDTSTFRWILVIVGFAIIGLILFGNPDRKRKPRAWRKRASAVRMRRKPEAGDHDARQAELAIDSPDDPEGRVEPRFGSANDTLGREDGSQTPEVPPDKIITLFLLARDNHVITGVELLDASLKSGLVFGERDIFHRINEEDLQPVFSMANLTNPGTFDKTAWNTIELKGVTVFMTLPGPVNALDAWDSMLATSRRLAELLHADLLDDTRSVFTRQRALQIKDELREYERQKTDQS
ncbi:MAG: cell division protein ZipA [Gammaproteobacteria bacterium]|nr:MAG: cell division protein ZipA [Gammaproteobacteria bacterium]